VFYLFVLLTLRMSLIALLVCCLRVLLSSARVLFALGVVALAVMFGCGTMSLCSIIVMFGCFIVFIFSHNNSMCCWFPSWGKPLKPVIVPAVNTGLFVNQADRKGVRPVWLNDLGMEPFPTR
jgi:hypothetical protein